MSIDKISNLNIISRATQAEGFKDVLLMYRLALLTQARGQGVLLSFTVHFTWVKKYGNPLKIGPGEVELFRDHGIRPSALQDKIAGGSAGNTLVNVLRNYSLSRKGVDDVGIVTEIEMTMVPAP